MTISAVIPVWNDAKGVQGVLSALNSVDLVSEIIVVDDHSVEVIESQVDLSSLKNAQERIKFIRHDENKSAGAARNTGLQAVTNPFVIFLDSDDLPTDNFSSVLSGFLDRDVDFDFAMFRHLDSREIAQGRAKGLPVDELCWDELEASDSPQIMTSREQQMMAAVSAYPWNKLYRTDFLKAHNIKCTEIPVHNDIELHWVSFLLAKKVLYSHTTGLTHVVAPGGARITNRKGAERIRVFEAMQNVVDTMGTENIRLGMRVAFWHFCNKLMRWIPNNLDETLTETFFEKRFQFIMKNLTPVEFTLIAHRDPALSTHILELLKATDS